MLKISNLNKKYRNRLIFKDLNYTFEPGIYILMGQNGSGKSTLFKMIAGLDKNYLGQIEAKNVYYLPEKLTLPKGLSTYEFIDCYARINKSLGGFYQLTSRYKLENKQIRNLSKGMIQKVGIITSLMDHYDVILYDEPLEGLDEASIKLFFEDIKRIEDTIIIISLHEIPKNIKIPAKKIYIKDETLCEE